jgi:zinc transport system ATP-binding protein
MSSSSQPVVHLENVSFGYNGEPVLKDVNLRVAPKEFVWVVGPNGGGKTTLIKLILGLIRPQEGRIVVLGGAPSAARASVGYMPQSSELDSQFPVTVLDMVLLGRLRPGLLPRLYRKADKDAALRSLETVGLADAAHRPLRELSGGQHRRILIARALASEPQLLLLDEPTANLDVEAERELHSVMRHLTEQVTVMMVSHDPAFASDFVEHVVCVNRTVGIHPTSALKEGSLDELWGGGRRIIRHDRHMPEDDH